MCVTCAAASRLAMRTKKANPFDALYSPIAVTASLLALWEIGVHAFHVNSVILPPPSEIMQVLIERRGLLLSHLSSSLFLIVCGLALFVVGGVSVPFPFPFSRKFNIRVFPISLISLFFLHPS